MKFGTIPLAEAEGALLAHAQRLPGGRLPKGRRLSAGDVEALRAAGLVEIVGARLEPGDLTEDEAAARIGVALAGEAIGAAAAATGRVNLFAGEAGLFLPDRSVVDALNAIDPDLTLATLPEYAPVPQGAMVATVKIIPLALPGAVVSEAVALLRPRPALRLAPFSARSVALVQTELPSLKPSVLDKTRRVLDDRLAASGSHVVAEVRCPHRADDLTRVLHGLPPADLVVVFGASAVIDAGDVIPAAIEAAGGVVEHLGMPVDPGNLLLLGRLGEARVLGAPGCARSPKENGFDWVLDRLVAGLEVTPDDIRRMGVGGLLAEIASRPQPRETNTTTEVAGEPPRVSAVVLAAGRSSRMGGPNKLLATFDGVPLVRRSVETALASRAGEVIVVTGHMEAEVRAALAGLPVAFVSNPRFGDGLATSLVAGFGTAVAGGADGVLVMLADQPLLTSAHLDAMIAAFRPSGAGAIVLAADEGRRANPVILSGVFRDAVAALSGDVGARGIVAANGDLVSLVEIGRAASLDVDTPEAMAEAGGRLAQA